MPEHILKKPSSDEPRLPLWLAYLWQRLSSERLGLVLGAGVTKDAGCPLWSDLISRLSVAMKLPVDRISSHRSAGLSEAFIAEVVYRNHSTLQETKTDGVSSRLKGFICDATWRDEIHKCLYSTVSGNSFEELISHHIYIKALAELVCKSRFAVIFNFDDIIDEAATQYAAALSLPIPEVITRPKVETRKGAAVIYHINGLLPREEVRRASDKVILTEDAFADILLSTNSYEAEFVINQFSVKTFLLMGVSLSDNSLKNLLRASTKRNPANHHFIIYHEDEAAPRTAEERKDIFEVNLHVYNLISIFLTSAQMEAFIGPLNCRSSDRFADIVREVSPNKIDCKYYLVGSVASGKTSTLEALRCFTTHEEWTRRPPAEMYVNDMSLTPEQRKIVDEFLFPEMRRKNERMTGSTPGIRIMDRAYFDPFAFSRDKEEVFRKAKALDAEFTRYGKPFEDGQIFFLRASDVTLGERMVCRGSFSKGGGRYTGYDTARLIAQEAELKKIYRPAETATFDTSDTTVSETAKRIARAILLQEYVPFSFKDRLNEIIAAEGTI